MADLPVGTFRLEFSKAGFANLTFTEVKQEVGQTRTLDAALDLAGKTEQATVNESMVQLDRVDATLGSTVEVKQVEELPINGRNWATLTTLVPGATDAGAGDQRTIRFVGHGLDDNNLTLDGVDATAVFNQEQREYVRLTIPLDSIEEFDVKAQTFGADVEGGTAGAQVSVVSPAGTNAFHGSVFDYFRNNDIEARSPFDGTSPNPFLLNQFGGSFGGPIVKNKLFFYANYEGLRQNLGQTFINFVPNAAFRAQVLAKSPVLKPILDAYPIGQTPIDSITDQVTKVATDTIREDAGMFRFDYRFSDKTTAFARYNVDNAYIDVPTDALGTHNVIPHIPTNFVLSLQHIFSPSTVNETKFGVNRANYHNFTYGTAPVAVSPGPFDGVVDTSLDTEVGTTFSYIDNLTLVRGRHTFKTGVDIRRIRLNNSGNTLTTSSLSYDTATDFINNTAASATYLQGEGVVGNRRTFYQAYVQDEFKATPNLTLNLGLRYEYYSVVHEILNRSAVVDILGCGGYCPKGTPYYDPNTKDFGPRVGLSWAPAMFKGKTTIRAGFGIY